MCYYHTSLSKMMTRLLITMLKLIDQRAMLGVCNRLLVGGRLLVTYRLVRFWIRRIATSNQLFFIRVRCSQSFFINFDCVPPNQFS